MTDLVEALRLEGDRRVSEKEMAFGNGKSREDRIADDLCYQAASRISHQDAELERMRRELAEALKDGHWTAYVSDCAPPCSRRDNPLRNLRTIRLTGSFPTEAKAIEAATAAIKSGWANGNTIIHAQTAKALASFSLPQEAINSLGRAKAEETGRG